MSEGYSCCCFLLDLATLLTYFLVPDTPGPLKHDFPPNSVLHKAASATGHPGSAQHHAGVLRQTDRQTARRMILKAGKRPCNIKNSHQHTQDKGHSCVLQCLHTHTRMRQHGQMPADHAFLNTQKNSHPTCTCTHMHTLQIQWTASPCCNELLSACRACRQQKYQQPRP